MKKFLGFTIMVTLLSILSVSCQHSTHSKAGCADKSKPCSIESKVDQKTECEDCKNSK